MCRLYYLNKPLIARLEDIQEYLVLISNIILHFNHYCHATTSDVQGLVGVVEMRAHKCEFLPIDNHSPNAELFKDWHSERELRRQYPLYEA